MTRRALTCLGVLLVFGPVLGAAPEPTVGWPTRPSADVALAFVIPGEVADVRVKIGDAVKKGDVLIRLDDKAERIRMEQLKAQAEDEVQIKAAEAQVAQRKADLGKLEWAGAEGAATQWEIDHARLEVTIGELSTALARFKQEQARLAYEEAKARLEKMVLVSPIAGKVEQVLVEVGEPAEALKPVIRVVNVDVLWIDAPVPLARAARLKLGDTVQVEFSEPKATQVPGKVVHVVAVADAASEAVTVRVEVPNPTGRPAGERVTIHLPDAAKPAGNP